MNPIIKKLWILIPVLIAVAAVAIAWKVYVLPRIEKYLKQKLSERRKKKQPPNDQPKSTAKFSLD
jgi:flagellar basal body-associated protein FliL